MSERPSSNGTQASLHIEWWTYSQSLLCSFIAASVPESKMPPAIKVYPETKIHPECKMLLGIKRI